MQSGQDAREKTRPCHDPGGWCYVRQHSPGDPTRAEILFLGEKLLTSSTAPRHTLHVCFSANALQQYSCSPPAPLSPSPSPLLPLLLQILDECSQFIEPLSFLPIARFSARVLIGAGDPKQLPPTLSGKEASEPSNDLSKTLFSRLANTGIFFSMLPCLARKPFFSRGWWRSAAC